MAKARRKRKGGIPKSIFDDFFGAAENESAEGVSAVADSLETFDPATLEGKFLVLDREKGGEKNEPFILVPAHVYAYVPWWGWTAIGLGLLMLAAGVVFMPLWSLDRLASRLGDENPANAQLAMRTLVMNGDERTVRKLYDMAASAGEALTARLRAIDTMSLIPGVPEVDRSLLRLELAGGTNEQVREAAIAARKQREASRTRGAPQE